MEKQFTVVVNNEGQHSVWNVEKEIPSGWKSTGFTGLKNECLDNIQSEWKDIRPASLIAKMNETQTIKFTQDESIQKHEEMMETYRKRYAYDLDSWSNYDYLKDCIKRFFTKFVDPEDRSVFEVGVGSGISSEFILKSDFQLTGIDVIEHKNWPTLKVTYGEQFQPFVGDILKVTNDSKYDIILDNGCFHHFQPEVYTATFDSVKSLMKDEGKFFLAVFEEPDSTKDEGQVSYLDGGKRRCKFFTEAEIEALLNKNGFVLEDTDRVSRSFDNVQTLLCICKKK